ncbi:Uncharacterised protein [Orientia tsutsugamushi]|uniref:Uncharacterized protein n=1 Tax=Orientia tsutsugamushi TaxID=784 RepID=A0A2R8F522_ORITS|nr:Uncharacterised protein [Orientia tsutsugamushi]
MDKSLDLYDHSFRTCEYSLYQRMLGERMEEKEYNFIYGTNAFQELSIGVYICSKISKKVFLQ